MEAVALRTDAGWRSRFSVMLGLSVVVAVMGLSLDSAAVVIGAMLLAPLMTPVMGVAAALAMFLPRHLVRSLLIVVVASVAAVGLAFLLAATLPDSPLPDEVLSRTGPDLRDLMVALAAGAAGAYATVRRDVSTALPGAAVAVALVPPLAAIGMTMEAGRGDLAGGAMLLYAANLFAIVLIGVVVFLLTGFVHPRRLEQKRSHVIGASVVVAAATVCIAVPLALASVSAAQNGRELQQLHGAATAWLQGTGNDMDEVRVDGPAVRIRVSGPNPPPPIADLERAVQEILGEPKAVNVRWTQTQEPTSEPANDGPESDVIDEQLQREAITQVVNTWLTSPQQTAYELEELEVNDDEIRVDVTSADPPPAVDELSTRLGDELGLSVPVVVNWTQRTTLRPSGTDTEEEDTLEQLRRQLHVDAQDWALDHDGLVVADVNYDGEQINVDLHGPRQVDTSDLEDALKATTGARTPVQIWFTERRRLS